MWRHFMLSLRFANSRWQLNDIVQMTIDFIQVLSLFLLLLLLLLMLLLNNWTWHFGGFIFANK